MAARLGNILYWLGTIIAVVAIGGAIIWNGVTESENFQAEKNLDARNVELAQVVSKLAGRVEQLEARHLLGILSSEEVREREQTRPAERFNARLNMERRLGDEFNFLQHRRRIENGRAQLAVAREKRETALIIGGFLVLFSLFTYGVGWVARYFLRRPRQRTWRRRGTRA